MKKSIMIITFSILLIAISMFTLSCYIEETPYSSSSTRQITITFKQEGFDDIVRSIESGAALTDIPTPQAIKGYTVKWDASFENITDDLVVNVTKTPIEYTILYEMNDGANNEGNIQKYTIETEFDLLDPTKDGFEFSGWYSDKELTKRVIKIEKGTTENITLWAKWTSKENAVRVTFNTDGGTSIPKLVISKGECIRLNDLPATTKKGYKFSGWYYGNEPWTAFMPVTRDMTLTARWTLEKYEITYVDELNVKNPNPTTYTVNNEIIFENLSKVGYTFEGWYNGATKVTKIEKGSTGELTLTAKWTANDLVSTKTDINEKWSGKTLNVLVTRYDSTPTYPWGQIELNPSSFGSGVGLAFDERQALIEDRYGVNVNWIAAQSKKMISMDLATAELSDSLYFDLALPRMDEFPSLFSSVYDISSSDYLDLRNSYYSQSAYDTFTVSGHTFFMSGGHDFMDDQSTNAIFLNKDLLLEKIPSIDIYKEIKDGNWIYDDFISLASLVGGDDGSGTMGDEDTYGFATVSPTILYECFGVSDAEVDESTHLYDTVFDKPKNKDKVNAITSIIMNMKSSGYKSRITWNSTANMLTAFEEGRILLMDAPIQKMQELDFDFSVGIIPFPKYDIGQENYISTTASSQATLICIPKVTQDREMSEYFLDVLSWTGELYMVSAWLESIESKFDASTIEDDMEILQDYVLDKMVYDPGKVASWGAGLFSAAKEDLTTGGSSYDMIIPEYSMQAGITIQSWNEACQAYIDN